MVTIHSQFQEWSLSSFLLGYLRPRDAFVRRIQISNYKQLASFIVHHIIVTIEVIYMVTMGLPGLLWTVRFRKLVEAVMTK
jgi:hypothetical protein